jgi:hypothetical protein
MKKIIIIAVIAAIGWYGNYYYRHGTGSHTGFSKPEVSSGSRFKCDGRTRCSQMTSCEEATFSDYNGFGGGSRKPPREADIKRLCSQFL